MYDRELIKNEIDILPDYILDRLQEFILFQKFNHRQNLNNEVNTNDLIEASMSSVDFWDNLDDEI